MSEEQTHRQIGKGWRLALVLGMLAAITFGIGFKLISLYVEEQEFLQNQGDARSLRVIQVPAHRGIITDRNGDPIAVSAPVATVWVDPKMADLNHVSLAKLAQELGTSRTALVKKISAKRGKRFMYLKRQVEPVVADRIRALKVPGIHVERDYKRFYPAGEVASHLVGFTNRDGKGQEGLELSYEKALRAEPGKQLVLKDLLGRTVKHIRSESAAQHGQSLQLTIDMRLQYLAYRELKAAVTAHKADAASLVMLDAKTGEVLAMANYPSYNPNNPADRVSSTIRNRAVTDLFEPGSTMKPMTVAAALMSGKYGMRSVVDTTPGYMRVKGKTIRDHRNYGELDITGIITKSSNVGSAKLALSLEPGTLHHLLQNVGLGTATGIGFPGERSGRLPYLAESQILQRATMSYGYGLSVTPLQLAQAYLPLANDGILSPVSLLHTEKPLPPVRVMPAQVARSVRGMMETVISIKGTGKQASIPGYRVAGKTGTVHKVGSGGYIEDQYISVFAGIAPASDPKVITVVMVDNPRNQEYYGGEVAAPIFSRAVGGTLRLLNVPPDNLIQPDQRVDQQMVQR
ncbi:peptidoglycan D,D-transpeptidase FtsI family protein [Pontibacterium sp.]|uniref:peptidoglycan D,D-transpeptidase FtsI family protein n=1 Tax=Pontibacterium sp. TaxID=2036026 RepID=UPI003512A7CB